MKNIFRKKKADDDILFKKGKNHAKINGADIYNIDKQDSFKSGDLKIISFKGLKIYAYTFG